MAMESAIRHSEYMKDRSKTKIPKISMEWKTIWNGQTHRFFGMTRSAALRKDIAEL